MDDDDMRDTPPGVTAAVAAGTGALPFLAVYATMFIVHGQFHHVAPPDVTNSNRGEALVGLLCLVLFVLGIVALLWLLNGVRRWPFVILQAAFFATSIDFLLDSTKGGPLVSGLVLLTSFAALVLSLHPHVWEHLGLRCPKPIALLFGQKPAPRAPMPAGSLDTADDRPTSARLVGRKRSAR